MELERLEKTSDKINDFQKKYNKNSKSVALFLGKNLTLILCMLIPVILVAFVWTDFGEVVFHTRMLVDGVVTIALFAMGEILMVRLGTEGGRLDEEYLSARDEFESLVKEVGNIGAIFMGVFCDWQIDCELEQATHYRLRTLRMTPKMWEDIKHLSPDQLEAKFGAKKAKKLMEINELEPIELNEAILLHNGEVEARGALPKGAQDVLESKKQRITSAISLVFTGLLAVSIAVSLTTDITIARVIYTVYKLTMLLFRMAKGYERGAKAYNTYEAQRLKAKSNYLRQYIKFVTDKTYLKLVDKYEELSYLIEKEDEPTPKIA